ncbi:hypothetical protein V8G54_036972 [Vigna mungo]|uniref:Uncharacterized protein n=1 Tax=Vigna mungo TaxID=3915 RepID=A0AAQ3RDI5_VIGMU
MKDVWLFHTTKEEALVEKARSVRATQQQRRSLILTDLTVEIASRRNRCSVRRFQPQQLPLITAARNACSRGEDLSESQRSGSAARHPVAEAKNLLIGGRCRCVPLSQSQITLTGIDARNKTKRSLIEYNERKWERERKRFVLRATWTFLNRGGSASLHTLIYTRKMDDDDDDDDNGM